MTSFVNKTFNTVRRYKVSRKMDRNEEIKSSTIPVNINIILSIIEELDRSKETENLYMYSTIDLMDI